jgi:polyhydroxyalkanoate synthesis regulator phasin
MAIVVVPKRKRMIDVQYAIDFFMPMLVMLLIGLSISNYIWFMHKMANLRKQTWKAESQIHTYMKNVAKGLDKTIKRVDKNTNTIELSEYFDPKNVTRQDFMEHAANVEEFKRRVARLENRLAKGLQQQTKITPKSKKSPKK